MAALAAGLGKALRRAGERDAGRLAHAPHRDDRHAWPVVGRLAAPHDDARARGAPSLADRCLRGLARLARARHLRPLRGVHRRPPGGRARQARALTLPAHRRRTGMIVPLTLGDFLERAELVYGHREAVADEPNPPGGGLGRVTYSQFADMARSLAAALDELGVAEHDRVAIVSPNAARFLVSLFGVSVFGRILVPVNFRLNAEEIRYIIDHSGSSVLLVDPELAESLRHIPVKHRFVLGAGTDPQLFLRKGVAPRLQVIDENATVSINYTSGTTARPKGVRLTHRNFWLNAVIFGWHLAMTDRDVYLHTLPTFHCNGWGMPYAVTGMGVRQVIIRKIDGEEILRRVEAEGVTLFNCAPAVIAGVRMRVDEEGELLARSNHVFEGYWNQPEETAKAIADGWFHTGDAGARDGAYIAITDRKKDVIISGGENVSSIEVEDCLFQHPAVAEVAVIGVPDEKWGETIKALVVLRPGSACAERELIEHCRSRMAHYKCPTSIEIRDALVRTATGKLQKFKLREPYWAGRERRVN